MEFPRRSDYHYGGADSYANKRAYVESLALDQGMYDVLTQVLEILERVDWRRDGKMSELIANLRRCQRDLIIAILRNVEGALPVDQQDGFCDIYHAARTDGQMTMVYAIENVFEGNFDEGVSVCPSIGDYLTTVYQSPQVEQTGFIAWH